jgi:hypothetical protein
MGYQSTQWHPENISIIAHIVGATCIIPDNLLCVLNTIPEEKQYNLDVLEPDNSEDDFGEKHFGTE